MAILFAKRNFLHLFCNFGQSTDLRRVGVRETIFQKPNMLQTGVQILMAAGS